MMFFCVKNVRLGINKLGQQWSSALSTGLKVGLWYFLIFWIILQTKLVYFQIVLEYCPELSKGAVRLRPGECHILIAKLSQSQAQASSNQQLALLC